MKNALVLVVALLLGSCASVPEDPNIELAMSPGMAIEADTTQGSIRVEYVDRYTRRYRWNGHDKTFRHQARKNRWYGSFGMYRPQGDGSMHAILEEGQQHFQSVSAARKWLGEQERLMDYVWTNDGLAVGWRRQERPGDSFIALHVNVWQILIDGKKPEMPGALPSRIKVIHSP